MDLVFFHPHAQHFDEHGRRWSCITFVAVVTLSIRFFSKAAVLEKERAANHLCRHACSCKRLRGAARVSTSLWNEEHQRLFSSLDVAAVMARGIRGSHLFGARHHANFRRTASQRRSRIRSFISALAREVTPQVRGEVPSDACSQSKAKPLWKVIRVVDTT